MRANILALLCVCLVQETGAEEDLKTRVAILDQAVATLMENDALKSQTFRIQEDALKTQQLMMTEQAKTIEQLKDKLNVQTNTLKKLQDRLDEQLITAATHFPNNITIGIEDLIKQIVEDKCDGRRTARAIESPIAFTAVKSQNQSSIGVNQNILFDKVILNDGGGFHAQLGIFLAPVSGYYLFSTSILHPSDPSLSLHAGIMHFNNIIAIAHSSNGFFDQGAQTVVLKLSVLDQISIRNLKYGDESVYGESFSSFTGVLLYRL